MIAGAEPWSRSGQGERARTGIAIFHGFTGNPVSTRPLASALAERGFAIELSRFPGHGTHVRDMMRSRFSDWRAEVVRVLDTLRARSDAVVLVGLSMGGTLCLDVASERSQEVAGVVPINATFLPREGLLARLAPLIEKLVPAIPAKAAGLIKNDIAKGGDEKAYAWVPSAAANSLLVELPRIRRGVRTLKVPLLVAWSRQDHSVAPENSQALVREAGSEVTELVLERSYHVATLDHDLPILVDAITKFADRVAGPRTPSESNS